MNDAEMMAAMKGWSGGKPETLCGQASTRANAAKVAKALPQWIEQYRIKALNDAGAGDLGWISEVELGCDYYPFDLIPRRERVTKLDISREPMPPADAILCRYVLNHLSEARIKDALNHFGASAKYLMATQFFGQWQPPHHPGDFCEYDLAEPPFGLGPPLEKCEDHRGVLALWRLP